MDAFPKVPPDDDVSSLSEIDCRVELEFLQERKKYYLDLIGKPCLPCDMPGETPCSGNDVEHCEAIVEILASDLQAAHRLIESDTPRDGKILFYF